MGVGGQSEPAPIFSWQQVEDACKNGKKLLVIDGNVCDVSHWVDRHPGGKVEVLQRLVYLYVQFL
jgi:cytochrome b involved in lipid metabolism